MYVINRITLTYSWCNIKHLILARVFKRGTTSTRLEKNSLHKTGKKLQKRTKVEKRWPKQSPDVDKIFTPWNFCPGIFIQMTVNSYFVGGALSFVLMRISKSCLRVSTGLPVEEQDIALVGLRRRSSRGQSQRGSLRRTSRGGRSACSGWSGAELRSWLRTQKRGRTQKLSVSWSAGDKLITDSLFRREHKIQWVQYM